MHLDNDKLKQTIFLIALFALAGFLFWLLWGFVNAFLGSVVFYVLLRRPLFYLTEKAKRKWPKALAIVMLMFASFVVLVLPIILISLMLSGKITYLISHYEDILLLAQRWNGTAQQYFGVDLLSPETVGKLTTLAANVIPGFLSATVGAVVDIFILYFVLYFMLASARKFESYVRDNLPFTAENNHLLLTELRIQTVSNAIGIPVLAILQAFTAFAGYYFLGVDEPLFWAVVTGLMSMLPVVGTTIVWVPLAIVLYAGGKHWQGLVLAGYGALIITNIDNVLRFMMQKKLGDIHPLITFFGVLIGLPLFGFVGIIFGPLLISYFILLVKIYRNEHYEERGKIIVEKSAT
ncbi:MAG TPA: AI-2E family transporter [Chitinophagales bacterium]|nr:AI-2E family transporter [Chitinophagales bacterium]